MHVATIQKLDRRLGAPLCGLLTGLRRLRERRPGSAPPELRRVLFVKLAEQGSTVLAAPALERARERFGRDNLYFLVLAENRFILDVLDLVPPEHIATIAHDNLPALWGSTRAALRRIRAWRVDAAVDMEFFSRGSALLAYASGARVRVGFHTYFGDGPYRGDLMTHRLLYNPYWHTAQIFQLLVEALFCSPEALPTLGLKPPPLPESLPVFTPTPGEREAVAALLPPAAREGRRGPLVLLNPNAGDLLPLRRWPVANYLELARRLLARDTGLHVAFTGGPHEATTGAELAGRVGSPRSFSLAGRTTLRQLLTLFTLADVLVTNDSGPAHFAALTPIRVVALFGPETPQLYAAPTPRQQSLWAGIACSPCVNAYNNRQSPCRDNVCMQQITVDQVEAAVWAALQAGRSAAARI